MPGESSTRHSVARIRPGKEVTCSEWARASEIFSYNTMPSLDMETSMTCKILYAGGFKEGDLFTYLSSRDSGSGLEWLGFSL